MLLGQPLCCPFRAPTKRGEVQAVFINPVPKPIDIILTKITNLFTSRKNVILLTNPNETAINALLAGIDKGLEIEVTCTFPFSNFSEAYQFTEKGGFIGKAAIEI